MIEGKTALVTGAASGIGEACILRFSRDRVYSRIYAADINPSLNNIFPSSEYPTVIPVQIDLRREKQINEMVATINSESGGIDVVINAAGVIVAGRKRPIYEYYRTDAGRQEMLSLWHTNEHAVYNIMQVVEETMRNQGGGTIINVTSSKNYFPDPYRREYEKSKTRIEELSLIEAVRLRRDNIRVVVVKPGNTKTNIDRGFWVTGSDRNEASVVQGFNDWWRKTFGDNPANVAEVIYQIAEGRINHNRVDVGFDAKLGHFLVKAIPLWRQMFYAGAYSIYGIARITRGFRSDRVDLSANQILDTDWYKEFMSEHQPRRAPVVTVDGKDFHRLGLGVSASVVQLNELGLTFEDLEAYVSSKVLQLGDQTRLIQGCEPEADGDWQYRYLVTQELESSLIYGRESVTFKSEEVFDNYLVFSPVK